MLRSSLLTFFVTAMGFAVTFSSPAASQVCHDRAAALKTLESKHGEVLIGRGLDNRGFLTELYMSQRGSWSILLTNPNNSKFSCIVGHGPFWRQYVLKKQGLAI